MASERMMLAIGTLERAIGRLEQDVAHFVAAIPPPPSPDTPQIDLPAAREALRSLDALIDELKAKAHG
ncbi:hypothetical protein [Sphingobium sp. Ant17]|uniref:hypothetical protein n=1 Tax=Sphingobium sp. Ant17 TaxID=1461752 RepID=UPI002E0E8611